MKKAIALIMAAVIGVLFICPDTHARARQTIGKYNTGGNWTFEEQGIRFSVYDFVNYETISTFDTFSPMCYNGKDLHYSDSCEACRRFDTDYHYYCRHHCFSQKSRTLEYRSVGCITPYIDLIYSQDKDGARIIYSTGCKLDYLYRYRGGESLNDLAHSVIDSIPYKMEDAIAASPNYRVIDPEVFSSLKQEENPYSIPMFERIADAEYESNTIDTMYDLYTPLSNFGRQLLSSDASVLETVLVNLGFYINSDTASDDLTFFDPGQYALVVEPVFWVGYKYDGINTVYFYGTSTEWALYAEYMKNERIIKQESSVKKADMTGGGVYSVTFGLVCVELPLSTMNHHRSQLALGQNLIIYPINDKVKSEYLRACPDRSFDFDEESRNVTRRYITPQVTSELSRIFLEYYGFDIITANDLVDLTVDIAATNTEFHPDTEAVMSFYIKQSADEPKMYCPDIENIGQDDAYGIRLNISTEPGSEIRRSDFTAAGYPADFSITCDGLPDQDDDGDGVIYNLAYSKIKLPDKTGTWQFSVTVDVVIRDETTGEAVYVPKSKYDKLYSNNGKFRKHEKTIEFSVDIVDPANGLRKPDDPSGTDAMPDNFSVPDASYFIARQSTPVTERSWTFYTVQKNRDKVEFVEHNVSAYANDIEYPLGYTANIPGSISGGKLQTRSGYGISVNALLEKPVVSPEGKSGVTEFQSAVILFPEYEYLLYGEALERKERNGSEYFVHPSNPYSIYYQSDPADYSRVHFTPVWYPDGEYTVIVYYFDMWTPVGTVWKAETYSADISGTVFDDWYITRTRRS